MILTIPIRTKSTINMREHWAVKAKRVKAERNALRLVWKSYAVRNRVPNHDDGNMIVALTRVAPRELDDDNLRPALKAVRDEIAEMLGLASDRDPRVQWLYGQERGKPKQYAVRVHVGLVAYGCPRCASGSLDHSERCLCVCHHLGATP